MSCARGVIRYASEVYRHLITACHSKRFSLHAVQGLSMSTCNMGGGLEGEFLGRLAPSFVIISKGTRTLRPSRIESETG